MKTLILLRHAKASWTDGAVSDVERGLKPKGWRQAEKVAAHLVKAGVSPERIWCSASRRTRETLGAFLQAWGMDEAAVAFEDGLYLADEGALLAAVRGLPDEVDRALILGHNPGLTDVANRLTGGEVYIKNVRPCGVVVLEFAVERWAEVEAGAGRLALHLRPKELED
jgi:phosphohistidine phosphatase